MANNERPVKFGLRNVHVAFFDPETGEYDTPKRMPGAISLTMNAVGSSSKLEADDTVYNEVESNQGYEGTLNIADMPEWFQVEALGYIKGKNGGLVEPKDMVRKSFALLHEVQTDTKGRRFVTYDVKVSRPTQNANTAKETIDYDTVELSFTAVPHEFTIGGKKIELVKGHVNGGEQEYDTFFDKVWVVDLAEA